MLTLSGIFSSLQKSEHANSSPKTNVQTDVQNTTNNTFIRETVSMRQIEVPIISNEYTIQTDTDTERQTHTKSQEEVPNKIQMLKYDLKIFLKYLNAPVTGYSCWFFDKYFSLVKLKRQNLQHGNVYDNAIKVKFVSDLIIKLDFTGLKGGRNL